MIHRRERIAWLFLVEMSIRRAVQQMLVPFKREDGWLWKENGRLLSECEFEANVRPLNFQ